MSTTEPMTDPRGPERFLYELAGQLVAAAPDLLGSFGELKAALHKIVRSSNSRPGLLTLRVLLDRDPRDLERIVDTVSEAAWKNHARSSVGYLRATREDDPTVYEARRKSEARRLGIRVEELDRLAGAGDDEQSGDQSAALVEAAPCPSNSPIVLSALLDEIAAVLRQYVVVEAAAYDAITLWAAWTWVLDAFPVAPRLAIVSPAMRCGKTRLLEVIGALVARPLPSSNLTPSAVFRAIDAEHPTLLIDEADTFLRGNQELRGVLNSGHYKAQAFTIRSVATAEGDYVAKKFSTWAAIAIAAIGKLPPTLMDRAIVIPMKRKPRNIRIARPRLGRFEGADSIRSRLARFALDCRATLAAANPATPGDLNDRAADNWTPLIAIAELASPEWKSRAQAAALALSGDGVNEEQGVGVQLLADIRDLLGDADKIASAELCRLLAEREDRPWAEFFHGKPISPPQLARQLGRFGIAPATIRLGAETAKGYMRGYFEEVFEVYLPPAEAVTTSQPNGHSDFREFLKGNTAPDVTAGNSDPSYGDSGCDVVTAEKPPRGAERISDGPSRAIAGKFSVSRHHRGASRADLDGIAERAAYRRRPRCDPCPETGHSANPDGTQCLGRRQGTAPAERHLTPH